MPKFFRLLAYFISFGFARGSLFIAPIVLANLLSPADYGTVEFVQAVATMGATLLGLGTVGAVPLVVVRKVSSASLKSILTHQLVCTAFLGLFAVLGFYLNLSNIWWLSALGVGTIMLQTLWSVTLKSLGRGEASLLVDAGFWSLLAMAASGAYFFSLDFSTRWMWVVCALIFYFFILIIRTLRQFLLAAKAEVEASYFSTLRTSMPLMLGALLSFLATTSGRIGVGFLAAAPLMAEYAILFRATAIPIVAHQIILVAGFRKIFEMPEQELEKKLPIIGGAVIFCVIAFWVASGWLGFLLGPAFQKSFAANQRVGLLILVQCILWSAISINDLVNARRQISIFSVRASVVYFAMALPLAWWVLIQGEVTLQKFVPIHSLVMVFYFLTQILVMWRHGVRLIRTWSLALLGFVGLSVLTQAF
ncbi:hypothetical protein [Zoogloea sp.]|uniref:hypothetical protein n=1 Tax=Zoogloea sp. TaxID=49181 RepID=UPI0026355C3E|nr:hypothetical protein [Zoogloea sp.]MDD3352756.1 hypothetical protein [Zoogloea sp.]